MKTNKVVMTNNQLHAYILGFCTKDADILDNPNNRRYWNCQAEDYDHAVEQLINAEPDTIFYELVRGSHDQ
jgi:hypothetical protein